MILSLGIVVVIGIVLVLVISLVNSKEKDMENTAKNFALQLGSLVSLYVSVTALIMLLFGIITVQYPDVAQGMWEYDSAASSIRFGFALLAVFFPSYIVLTRLVNTIRRKEHGTYLVLTKWLIYLSLLIGGATILGDLVAVINGFLNGELTIRFILKALAFLIVVGAAFTYYVFDARGYWQEHERRSIQYAGVTTVVVVIALILGFMRIEPPAQVREMKIDAVQIQDLQLIQSRIENYYAERTALPESLKAAYAELDMPTAPEGRGAYTYVKKSERSFELCAEFAYASTKAEQAQYGEPIMLDTAVVKGGLSWTHSAGNWCYTRTLNVPIEPVTSEPLQKGN